MERRLKLSGLAVIALVGAGLRLGDLSLIEFKGDEAVAIHLALPMVEGKGVPQVGLMSSVGIHNPPFFIYALAFPELISLNPKFITGFLIGCSSLAAVLLTFFLFAPRFGPVTAMWASAFYACGTWPVLYGRKLWAQDLLPIFSVLLLHCLLTVTERERTKWVAAIPVLLCVMWQLHFSGLFIIPVAAAASALAWRTINWKALGVGIAAAVLLTAPYLMFQVQNDYKDVSGLINMARGKKADGQAKEKKAGRSLKPVSWAAYVGPGTNVDYSMGQSAETYRSTESAFGRGFRTLGGGTGYLLLIGGLALLFFIRKTPHRVVAIWALGYVGIMLIVGLDKVYPHYFIILYPAQFLLMALPLGWLAQKYGTRVVTAASIVGVLVISAHLSSLFSYRSFLKEQGGVSGDYGVTYDHKQQLVEWSVGNGLPIRSAPGWEYGHMERMANAYGDLDEARAVAGQFPSPPDHVTGVRVYDTLRQPSATNLQCLGKREFGPLIACPVK